MQVVLPYKRLVKILHVFFPSNSDYDLDCMPPHSYIHVLSLTDKIAEFRRAINRQKISGNIDTPEGGFDAMLQAAVCQVSDKEPEILQQKICNCYCSYLKSSKVAHVVFHTAQGNILELV